MRILALVVVSRKVSQQEEAGSGRKLQKSVLRLWTTWKVKMRMGVSDVHLLAYLPNGQPLETLQPASAKDILAHFRFEYQSN